MPKISFENYSGREQAYIKHALLEKYLPQLGYKVGSQWETILYVDAFAGPWDVRDGEMSDSSFGVAIEALAGAARGLFSRGISLNLGAILVEKDNEAFGKLKQFADKKNRTGFSVVALNGEFITLLPEIASRADAFGNRTFRFVLLDPKGWKDIPIAPMTSFLKRRGCEVLVNLMTRFIKRFLAEEDRAESYDRLFGRPEVLPLLKNTPKADQADTAVREYCKSLHRVCEFRYVSSAVILEPGKDEIRYFLVYATNDPMGIQVFKDAERKASRLQDSIRHEGSQGDLGLFGDSAPKTDFAFSLWQKYCTKAKAKVLQTLLNAGSKVITYSDLFCDAMAFPMVTPDDLHQWLEKCGASIEQRREAAPGTSTTRKLDPARTDCIKVLIPAEVKKALSGPC